MLRRLFKRGPKHDSHKARAEGAIEVHQPVEGYYCKQCNELFDNMAEAGMPVEEESELIHKHHQNYAALRNSAQNGCRICIVILGDYQLKMGSDMRDFKTPIRYAINTGMADEGLEWRFVIEVEKRQKHKQERSSLHQDDSIVIVFRCEPLVCQILPYGNEQTSDLMSAKSLPAATNSAASLSMVHQWLADCINDHATCHDIFKKSWFPTRVLDLGSDNGPVNVKLYEHNHGPKYEPYMALSYQWGSSETSSPILTGETLTSLRDSIEITTLPKVIQDAIHLTKSFQVRYLWIDRLCIIQDDDEDWTRESAMMQQVYASSILSIAASDADTPQKGCFFTRNPLVVQPWKTTIPVRRGVYIDTSERGVSIGVRKGLQESAEYVIIPGMGSSGNLGSESPYKSWRGVLQQSSLYKRGWVLQESILAPRVLHCSQRQLYWECPHTVCSETFPRGVPKNRQVFDRSSDLRRELAVPGSESPILSGTRAAHNRNKEQISSLQRGKPRIGHQQWLDLVQMYTGCKLSFAKDKLIAISGVASAVAPALGKYVAGLWEDHLIFGLLWSVDSQPSLLLDRIRPSRPDCGYIAPSWSWASVHRPVEFHSNPLAHANLDKGLGFTSAIKIISVSVTSKIPGGFGHVSAGTLQIEAGLGKVEIGIQKQEDDTGKKYDTFLIATIDGSAFLNFKEIGGTTNQQSFVIFDNLGQAVYAAMSEELYCVPILVKDVLQVWDVGGIMISTKNRNKGVYVRVGYFYASGFGTSGVDTFTSLRTRPVTLE